MGRAIVHGYTTQQPQSDRAGQIDGYADKLAKYIPGEVLAGFVGLSSMAAAAADAMTDGAVSDWPVLLVFVAGLVATPGYLYVQTRTRQDEVSRPHMYVLAAVAFVPWAMVVSAPVRDWFGASTATAEFLLALAAFLLPLVDAVLCRLFGSIEPSPPSTAATEG